MEHWKPLNDEGLFEVSSSGRVRCHSHPTADGRVMKPHFVKCNKSKKDGYVRFNYTHKGVKCIKTLHRAVAELFVPNPGNKPEINHINGNKADNRAENLEWCTASENQRHALVNGLRKLNDPSHSKRVAAYSQMGELMAIYPSVAEASRLTGISVYRIYKRCEGKTQSHLDGYIWRYVS